jgi:hypothetical protein
MVNEKNNAKITKQCWTWSDHGNKYSAMEINFMSHDYKEDAR